MRRVGKRYVTALVAFLACSLMAGNSILLAQVPNNKQKDDEVVRSAQQFEMFGYVLAGAGILLVVAAIPVGIYLDRKKKARKRAERQAADAGWSSDGVEPNT